MFQYPQDRVNDLLSRAEAFGCNPIWLRQRVEGVHWALENLWSAPGVTQDVLIGIMTGFARGNQSRAEWRESTVSCASVALDLGKRMNIHSFVTPIFHAYLHLGLRFDDQTDEFLSIFASCFLILLEETAHLAIST